MKKCPVCKGNFVKVKNINLKLEKTNFVVKGKRCEECNEEFPYEEETQKVISTTRKSIRLAAKGLS